MEKIRVGINGLGRIGRITARLLTDNPAFELVGVNDLSSLEQMAHLLTYDSVHGKFHGEVKIDGGNLFINGKQVQNTASRDPLEIPWKKKGADLVFECTGSFTDYEGASKHLASGAKRVIVSAPVKDADKIRTFVYGINHETYNPEKDVVVSNASCTTNCLAPLVKVLHDSFKVTRGLMTTIHSYTNDQRILDLVHPDYRRMRAAALNMIPTSTGAAKAVTLVIPELKGKLTGTSIRVPTPNVSLVDFVGDLGRSVTVEEVNQAFINAAEKGPLKGVLKAVKAPLVSSDYIGDPASSSIDLESTMVIDGTMVKVLSWYDNETGFSQRMLDFAQYMNSKGGV